MAQRFCVLAMMCALAGALASPGGAAEPERFALLVGETEYVQPEDYEVPLLRGPANDVAAMKQLLLTRYHFKDDGHILVLTGPAASRKGIENAFKAQLVENAERHPNAVVVFYFSGHGSTTADLSGEEGDGLDETLVAYDSRAPNGKDIVDKDVNVWLNQLRKFTPNITVILDSCHSGTATRGGETSRSLPPNPNMAPPPATRGLDSDPTPHLLRKKTYVAIAAAMATESSYENAIAAAGGKSHGYLTWFLTQTLNRRPFLAWRQAMSEIQRGVASATLAQHPQVEGDIDRTAFGLAGDRGMPYVRLTAQDPTGNITIAAGVAQGVVEGGTLAIYAPNIMVLTGDTGKIATARVTFAGLSASRAVVIERTTPALPSDAKVTIVTPFYGTTPLQVRLDALPDQSGSPQELAVLQAVRLSLLGSAAIKPVGEADAWKVAIQKGCLDDEEVLQIASAPAGCKPVYYLAGRQSREPILNRFVPVSATDAADKLADALNQFARVSALRALTNDNSPLRLSLDMLRAEVSETPAGELVPGPTSPISRPTNPLTVHVGDWFTFKVTNLSSKDVYATLLILNGSGSVAVLSEAQNGDLVKAGKSMIFTTPLHATPPVGIDTYKVVATTKSDMDFSVLESPDQGRAVSSPLQRYLAAASSIGAKDGAAAKDVKLGEWVTEQVDVKVLPAPKGTKP